MSKVINESWHLLLDASLYIIFGIAIGGLLKTFLSTKYVAKNLGQGRFLPVIKSALFGIPIPLCSCGVLPAAASLKKQGASNAATIAFMVSTPESGIDSISITYALLDPLMTVARPVAAFISAIAAGFAESILGERSQKVTLTAQGPCNIDGCCSGEDCSPEEHKRHHNFPTRAYSGLKYAFTELWGDIAAWFFVGLLFSGIITVIVPNDLVSHYLGGGPATMLIMLVAGIPLYICASASTPIAAALILKGASPGAALVFLLVGPATNIASLSVMTGLLGKTATLRYLIVIALSSIISGLALDLVYNMSGISAAAVTGEAAEIIPYSLRLAGATILMVLSIKPLATRLKNRFRKFSSSDKSHGKCECSSTGSCSSNP